MSLGTTSDEPFSDFNSGQGAMYSPDDQDKKGICFRKQEKTISYIFASINQIMYYSFKFFKSVFRKGNFFCLKTQSMSAESTQENPPPQIIKEVNHTN